MYDSWWRQMARGTICVAGLMSACTTPGRGVQARVPAAVSPARESASDRLGSVTPSAWSPPAQPRSSPR
jgi:hypothetical protein